MTGSHTWGYSKVCALLWQKTKHHRLKQRHIINWTLSPNRIFFPLFFQTNLERGIASHCRFFFSLLCGFLKKILTYVVLSYFLAENKEKKKVLENWNRTKQLPTLHYSPQVCATIIYSPLLNRTLLYSNSIICLNSTLLCSTKINSTPLYSAHLYFTLQYSAII